MQEHTHTYMYPQTRVREKSSQSTKVVPDHVSICSDGVDQDLVKTQPAGMWLGLP
jgi:hypothetical protein